MPDSKGRFVRGERASRATEFKPGEHWRRPKPYWKRGWLYHQYIELERSAGDIAADFGCTDINILYFLKKHSIPRRTVAKARAIKHWGLSGEANGMFGKRGPECPNWKGGLTPARQALYASLEWSSVVRKVWARDGGTCQRCGIEYHKQRTASHIHHIVSFAIVELRTSLDNLITLCEDCHHWIHSLANIDQEFIEKGGGEE